MASSGMNYLAILVAGVVYFALGAVWYAAPIFGNSWLKGIGKSKEQAEADFNVMKLVWAFLGSLIIAYGIARILSWSSGLGATEGMMVGALGAVSLVGAWMLINERMESRPMSLFWINFFYNLVGFVIMGAIIGAWR